MKFGKVQNIDAIDFSIPKASASTQSYIQHLPVSSTAIHIGCTGWTMKEWIGAVYPKGTKAKDFVEAYTKRFNAIEFNTTHYRIPSPKMIENWKLRSAPDFKFCPKLPQVISHRNDMGLTDGRLDLFISTIFGLKEKLGCCFMQLPPYFGAERWPQLLAFLKQWPAQDIQLAIEFRNETWFQSRDMIANWNTLRELGIGLVITDVAGRRDVVHRELTSPFTMIRFVGNGMVNSDLIRLKAWTSELKVWAGKLRDIYFFPHQPENLLAPQACEYLGQLLDVESLNATYRYPTIGALEIGEQMDLF